VYEEPDSISSAIGYPKFYSRFLAYGRRPLTPDGSHFSIRFTEWNRAFDFAV